MLSLLRPSSRFSSLHTASWLLPALFGAALVPRTAWAGDDTGTGSTASADQASADQPGTDQAPGDPATADGGTGAAPATTDEAALAEARLHFSNGVDLLQTSPPNYQDAFPQFLAAYEKSGQSWKVLGNLGLCALKLERDGEALAYYRRYLDEGGDEIDPEERSDIERELLLVEGNLAHVSLSTAGRSAAPETNVRLTVSRQGSSAPPQLYQVEAGQTLGLRAGAHTLTAESGGKTRTWEVVLSPGQTAEHVFDFAETPAPSGTLTPATVTDSGGGGGMSPVRLTGFVTAGVGVAALIGGGVTGFLTKQKEDSGRDQCNGNVCATTARDDFDSAESLATLTNVLLIGGGVLAATGVTLILLGDDSSNAESPTSARVQLTPSALPQGGGLWATGTF